jgi:hypothetical protein
MKKKDAEEIFRFHWEFMRRDPKYKEAFDRVMEIERQYYEGKEIDKGILFEEVKETFQEFHLQIPWDPFSFPRLPDPYKSFDELTAHFSAMIYLGTNPTTSNGYLFAFFSLYARDRRGGFAVESIPPATGLSQYHKPVMGEQPPTRF